jgi:hypothetical protein
MMAKEPVLAPKVTTWINVEILDEPVFPSNDVAAVEEPVVEVADVE